MTLQMLQIRRFFLQSVYCVALLHNLICQAANLYLLPVHFGGKFLALLCKLYAFDSLNQSEFCKKLGIRQSTLSSYENGTVSPSNEVLYAIAKQYHVSLDWLFGISDNEFSLSSMGDIISFLLELNELKE